jgi:hypothetical protein
MTSDKLHTAEALEPDPTFLKIKWTGIDQIRAER